MIQPRCHPASPCVSIAPDDLFILLCGYCGERVRVIHYAPPLPPERLCHPGGMLWAEEAEGGILLRCAAKHCESEWGLVTVGGD